MLDSKFEAIYKEKKWGVHGNTLSGQGSSLTETRGVVDIVKHLIDKYNIKTIADICGDFSWQDSFLKGSAVEKYLGYDISSIAVSRAESRFKELDVKVDCEFKVSNLCEQEIEHVDLFICRDVLVHLDIEHAKRLLDKNLRKAKYILLTSFSVTKNKDIDNGNWRPLNMLVEPFEALSDIFIEEFLEQPYQEDLRGDKRLVLLENRNLNLGRTDKESSCIEEHLTQNTQDVGEPMAKTKDVPKLLFTYWSGDKLSLLHFITLRAAKQLNPDYKLILYTAKPEQVTGKISYVSHEHSTELTEVFPFKALCADTDVLVREIDVFSEYGFSEPLFHTYVADIVRIKKLEEHGGIWFDMDLLFTEPLTEDITVLRSDKSCIVTSYSNTIATGLVSGLAHSPFFKQLSLKVDEYLAKGKESNFERSVDFKDAYQAFGPDLWRALAAPCLDADLDKHEHIQSFKRELVYPYLWNEMSLLFGESESVKHKDVTQGIHWYNGSSETRRFINELSSFDSIHDKKSPMWKSVIALQKYGVRLGRPSVPVLKKESLRGANLQGANLQSANLQGMDLRDANLQNANLHNANLRFADLRGASLWNANLLGADLSGAVFEDPTKKHVDVPTVGVSIVLASYNRLPQLRVTLDSFEKSAHNNFEVIIVDDASSEEHRVQGAIALGAYKYPIKIVTINEAEKTWRNPGPAYNIGFRYATKEIVMIQNAEVAHIGDVISFVARNMSTKDWISLNCYGLTKAQTEKIMKYVSDVDFAFNQISKESVRVGGNSVANEQSSGWLNHFDMHFVAYHYCGAIFKSDLDRYLDGGFSDMFSELIGGEDDEFIKRLLFNKFTFKISEFREDTPFVVHQYHEKCAAVKSWTELEHKRTMKAFAKSCLRMGFMPENNIELAPKQEIPKSRQQIIS